MTDCSKCIHLREKDSNNESDYVDRRDSDTSGESDTYDSDDSTETVGTAPQLAWSENDQHPHCRLALNGAP